MPFDRGDPVKIRSGRKKPDAVPQKVRTRLRKTVRVRVGWRTQS